MRVLRLVTSEYPFGKQETFLETEVFYLSKEFDQVIIYPSKLSGKARVLPDNFSVDIGLANEFDIKFRKLKSFFTFSFLKALILNFKWVRSFEAIKRINTYNTEIMAIRSFLLKNKFSEEEIWYTYWFNGFTYELCRQFNNYKTIIVSRGHRYDVNKTLYSPAFLPFWDITISRLNKLFLVSAFAYNLLIEEKYKKKIEVSRLGVLPASKLNKRSSDNVLRIVTVSNLIPVKRVDLLASYLVQFCNSYSKLKIKWTHFGDGFQLKDIKQILSNKRCDNLEYDFKGRIPNNEILKYFSEAEIDLFLNVSKSEGVPVSIMEAIAHGIPILATDVGGNSEIVNKQNGILLSSIFCYEELKTALLGIINKTFTFNPETVVSSWNNSYNAESNYKHFSKQLKNI